MTIHDGEAVDATNSNRAWLDSEDDDTAVGKISFANTEPVSGTAVTNIQKNINSLSSYSGWAVNGLITVKPAWTNNYRGTTTDSIFDRVNGIDGAFNSSGPTGHAHDPLVTGDGAPIDASNLDNINLYFADFQTVTITGVTGDEWDITTEMSGKSPSGSSTSVGVVTVASNNRCELRNPSSGDQFENADGLKVFGRITYGSGIWDITFYTFSGGVETQYNFVSSTNILIYFVEVFDQFSRPTFGADLGRLGSLDATTDVIDASLTESGKVNTSTQVFGGLKIFKGLVGLVDTTATSFYVKISPTSSITVTANRTLSFDMNNANRAITFNGDLTIAGSATISGTNTGDVSLAAFGSTPSTTGASLSGQAITLQPADATHPGGVSTGTQTFAGNKTFSGTIAASNLSGTNTGDATLATFGSTPAAEGASLSGQALTLQPADATHPGGISTGAQTIPGGKTFAAASVFQKQISTNEAVDSSTTGSNANVSAPTVSYLKFTNASLSSIQNIGAGSDGQILVITNGTGGTITIVNDSGGTATDRIITGSGSNLSLANTASSDLIYDANSTRWRIIGGTGGGGGFTNPMTNQGDIIYGASGGAATRFAAGSAGQDLKTTSTVPVYTTPSPNVAAENYSLAATVSSNAMTVALKDPSGNDPSSTSPVYIVFRNATAATGTCSIIAVTGALSVVIPSGATMGTSNGVEAKFNVGILNNAGTAELVVSGLGATTTDGRISSTTIDTASDTSNTFYSTTGRSNVAYKLLGAVVNTQSTAGTYATSPSAILLKGCGLYYVTASSDWVSYTPTFSWTANITSSAGKWRRVGDSMEIMMGMTLSGAPTSATLTATIPSGNTLDTTKQANTTQFSQGFGVMQMLDAAVKSWNGLVVYNNTTTMSFTSANSSDGSVDQSRPFTWGNGDAWGCRFTIPIVGWFAKDWQ